MRFFVFLVVLFASAPVFAVEQFQTNLSCEYEKTDSFFGKGISFGVFQSSKSLAAIYDYPVRKNTQIDAAMSKVAGKLSFDISHTSDAGIVQIDHHEVDVNSKSVVSSITTGGSGQAVGYCYVSFDLPESSEECSYWQADTDVVRGGEICVSNHLTAYKTNTYGATSLMRAGAWCGSMEAERPMKATLSYYGYDIYASSPSYTRIGISNGYNKSQSVFDKNARAKTIIVSSGNFFQEAFVLQDTMVEQFLDFGEFLQFEELEIEIIDTYPGTSFEHVCVSSIYADFEYDPEFGSPFGEELLATKIDINQALALKETHNNAQPVTTAPTNGVPSFIEAEPKPTQGIKSADRPKPLTIEEYKVHFGWPEKFADYKIQTSPQLHFAIIDNGFNGLDEYLATRPGLKERVTYVDLGGDGETPNANHGLHVFQVTDEVMPTGNILLLDVSLRNKGFLEEAIDEMNKRGFYYGTMSISSFGDFDRTALTDELPSFLQKLEDTQTTLFIAAGNDRAAIHSALPNDVDGDGKIEFWPNETTDIKREGLTFSVAANRETSVQIAWGHRAGAKGQVVANLYEDDTLVEISTFGEEKGYGIARIAPPLKKTTYRLEVELKNLSGVLPLLRVRGRGVSRFGTPWNGLRSIGDHAIWDSPFLIPVGSVGEIGGKLGPSIFSSIDFSNQGQVQPLIYGPGQLKVNDETFDGTSFSTPFIAALYSPFGTYNIRNYIEQTTSFKPFMDGLTVSEASRWGMPDYGKMLAIGGNECLKHKQELLDAKVENGRVVATIKFSRNCMERLKYGVTMRLETVEANPETGYVELVTAAANGQSVVYALNKYERSEGKAISDKVIAFSGVFEPIDARFKGQMVRPIFQLFTQIDRQGAALLRPEQTFLLNN